MTEIEVTRAHYHNGGLLEPNTKMKVPQQISREAAEELMRVGAARVTGQTVGEERFRVSIDDTLKRISSGEWTLQEVLTAECSRPEAQQRKGILALENEGDEA